MSQTGVMFTAAAPKQKIFFLGLDCYLLGRCDGQRLERENRRMKAKVFDVRGLIQ